MNHDDATPQTKGQTISWARWYDLASWLMSFGQAAAIRREILSAGGAKTGEAVLDVGCGTGTLAIAVAKRVGPPGRVAAIDASPQMVASPRARRSAGDQPSTFAWRR
jgi:ubiquinone/menaquinone biosynthesis C-methylase UbiE